MSLKILTTYQLELKESKKQTLKSSKASAGLLTFDFIIDFRVRSEDFTTQITSFESQSAD